MSFSTGIWLEYLVTVGTSRQVLDPGRRRGGADLPLEFPLNAFQRSSFIDFSVGPTLYVFEDRFSHALPVQAWESRVWEISARLWIQDASWKPVGYVEFDHRLYDDPSPIVFLRDGELVLRLMVDSVERSHAIRLASRVEVPLSPNGLPGLWNIETFEARATGKDGETLVLELGSKYILKRSCTVARAWLPGIGPDVCIAHLLMAPSFGGGGSPAAQLLNECSASGPRGRSLLRDFQPAFPRQRYSHVLYTKAVEHEWCRCCLSWLEGMILMYNTQPLPSGTQRMRPSPPNILRTQCMPTAAMRLGFVPEGKLATRQTS
ncbi:hypothetical protein B0H13DRAFT_1871062 [Mycena leptocephala]|nr:hypothetical protein B0H13DRAFT_1871062 [Mycena leptocephala]